MSTHPAKVALRPMSQIQRAWAGGLFEGEGSISVHRQPMTLASGEKKQYKYIYCQLAMCDEDVVRKLHRIVGHGKVCGPSKVKEPHHRPLYKWELHHLNAIAFLKRIYPYLGERRRAKILDVLAECERYEHEIEKLRLIPNN